MPTPSCRRKRAIPVKNSAGISNDVTKLTASTPETLKSKRRPPSFVGLKPRYRMLALDFTSPPDQLRSGEHSLATLQSGFLAWEGVNAENVADQSRKEVEMSV